MNFFFGLKMEVKTIYKQVPPPGSLLHVTQATLGATPASGRTVVKVRHEDKWLTVCTLNPGFVDQCAFDLAFTGGAEVQFMIEGASSQVHLLGYYEAVEDDGDDVENEDSVGDEEEEDEEEEVEVVEKPRKRAKVQHSGPTSKKHRVSG